MADDNRFRVWTCELYPSKEYLDDHGFALGYDGHSGYGCMPDNFMEIIDSWHIPCLLSPIHDKDPEKENSDLLKKPHYHLLIKFSGKKSFRQVSSLFDQINGVYCERESTVHDERGLARYFCHLDHPYKYQYDIGDVTTFSCYNYTEVIESSVDSFRVLCELQDFCRRNPTVRSYSELCEWCLENNLDWYRILTSRFTLHFTSFFKSRRFDSITPQDVKNSWS